jgi:hypothetical protein
MGSSSSAQFCPAGEASYRQQQQQQQCRLTVWQAHMQSWLLLLAADTWDVLLLMTGSVNSSMLGLWREQQQQSGAGISMYIMASM